MRRLQQDFKTAACRGQRNSRHVSETPAELKAFREIAAIAVVSVQWRELHNSSVLKPTVGTSAPSRRNAGHKGTRSPKQELLSLSAGRKSERRSVSSVAFLGFKALRTVVLPQHPCFRHGRRLWKAQVMTAVVKSDDYDPDLLCGRCQAGKCATSIHPE